MDRKYWDRLSESFSEEVIELANEDFNGVLLEELGRVASKRKRVVDLGCGGGVLVPHLAARFKEVCAVDFSQKLIERARSKYGGPKVEFLCGDLTRPVAPTKRFDVSVCSSVLILSSRKKCRQIIESIKRFTRVGGRAIITVPSLESCILVYHTLIRLRKELGSDNGMSRKEARRCFAHDVESVIDGNVLIQGVPTKHWMRDEIVQGLSDVGFELERVRRVEFKWESEIDSAPEWLEAPYPWDWLVVVKRVGE